MLVLFIMSIILYKYEEETFIGNKDYRIQSLL